MDDQTNLRYTFLREKYKNIGGCKKCQRYKCIRMLMCCVLKAIHCIVFIISHIYTKVTHMKFAKKKQERKSFIYRGRIEKANGRTQ